MTEDEAYCWLVDRLAVPRETIAALERFAELLRSAAEQQNLISASTLDHIWSRHIVDSAQLIRLAARGSSWIDLGSGAGFPGLIVALLGDGPVTLVESRRKRSKFLAEAIAVLGLAGRAVLVSGRAEAVPAAEFDIISARAFAPLDRLLAIGQRFAGPRTRWILPKGRSGQAELDAARATWQGSFRIEPSVTDPDAAIIVAEQVRPRKQL